MIQLRRFVLAVLAMLVGAGAAAGGTIYTTDNGGSLAKIDSNTGAGSVMGSFGLGSDAWGLAFAPDGALYVADGHLATVNLSTGAATQFGVTNGLTTLAFSPSGLLYGAALGGADLYRVDTGTGAATLVGPLGFGNIMDLAFNAQGALYAVAGNGGSSSYIYQLSATTGAGTLAATLNIANLMGLTFDASDNLYATNWVANSTLYSINLTDSSATPIGHLGFQSHGLDVDNFGFGVPEPAAWIFIGSGVLAFGGIRRPAGN